MPKSSAHIINIDLLRPQGERSKIFLRFLSWLLQSGRYIIIVVEIIVLTVFLARFKLDADIATVKEEIDSKIPFIENSKSDEILIRKTHFQLSTLRDVQQSSAEFSTILDKIAAQTPNGVVLSSITFEGTPAKINIKMSGIAQNNNELSTFVFGLRSDKSFSGVNISSLSLERGLINFSIDGSYTIKVEGEKST